MSSPLYARIESNPAKKWGSLTSTPPAIAASTTPVSIQLAAMAAQISQSIGVIIAGMVVLLLVGAFLSFKAYSRD